MASLGTTFNPNDVPQDERSFEPIPQGDYNCQITESEIVETRTGGEMLKLTLEVIDGPYANRKIWDNLNIRNNNPTAQSIAHRTLADLCAACGAGAIADSEELHFKPFVAAIKIEPERTVGDRTYDARNGVKRYKARGGQPPVGKAPAQPAARPAPQAARPAAAAPSRPWTNRNQPAATDDNIPF
ncbi:hypothetical protein SR39_13555 [Methylobacterium radiotolerans]|jgi:hypothetical protein|nr:hypothetical protein SR39_13555 [Methylobacterium radiotolerans]